MYQVVIGTLFINGKKHTRGDIVSMSDADAEKYGTRLSKFTPEVKEAPKRRGRPKKVTNED